MLEDEWFSGAECWRMKGSQGQSAGGWNVSQGQCAGGWKGSQEKCAGG